MAHRANFKLVEDRRRLLLNDRETQHGDGSDRQTSYPSVNRTKAVFSS